MPPAARRWSEFLDRLWELRLSIAEIDGVDFSQVQKPGTEAKTENADEDVGHAKSETGLELSEEPRLMR